MLQVSTKTVAQPMFMNNIANFLLCLFYGIVIVLCIYYMLQQFCLRYYFSSMG